MATDKAAIVKQAQLYTSRGQYDKAIAEWQRLLVGGQADATVHNTIGDLHLRRQKPMEAAEAYLQAAEGFKRAGDPLKAIAVYRKVLKLDPNRYLVHQYLGDLNAERGLSSSAIADYTTLAKLLLKQGRARDAVPVYRKMIQVEPSNLELKQRLAELCQKENLRAEAIEAYIDLGQECQAQHRRAEAEAAFQAALKLDPGNGQVQKCLDALKDPQLGPAVKAATAGAARASGGKAGEGGGRHAVLDMASRQIMAGEYAEAEAGLMDLLSREPGDPEVCRLLARLHLKRGELSVAMGEFQFLAGAAMRAEDHALAESMLLEYLEVDPRCPLVLEALGQVLEQKGDRDGAVARYGEALTLLVERPDPDQPIVPQDLLDKIKELAPESELIPRFAAALRGETVPSATIEDLEGLRRLERVEEVEPQASELPARPAPPPPRPADEERDLEVESPVSEGGRAPSFRFVPSTSVAEERPVAAPLHLPPDADGEAAGTSQASVGAADVAAEPAQEDVPMQPEARDSGPDRVSEPGVHEGRLDLNVSHFDEEGEASREADSDSPLPAVDEDEVRARFELGVAYKHMGLFDEALEEFRFTLGIKSLFLDTCCMLADVSKDLGQAQQAVSYYEQALTAARDDEERASEIRYELGVLAQDQGWTDKAIELFSTIPDFRDVAARLEQLSADGSDPGRPSGGADQAVLTGWQAGEPGNGGGTKKRRVSYL